MSTAPLDSMTLPQRLYLLTYTVDKARFEAGDLQGRGLLLRAGALAELTIGDLLRVDDGKVLRRAVKAPSDAFLAEVWHTIPTGKPGNWFTFLYDDQYAAEASIGNQLVAQGAITRPEKRTWSPVFTNQVTVHDPGQVRELQEAAREVVLGDQDPATVPADLLALVVLAATCRVSTLCTGKELRRNKATVKSLTAHFDKLAPKLRESLYAAFHSTRASGAGYGA
ncbi:GPP34 family phosphoprotein [Streptomyces sp. NPDC050400]|uniref:GOLPH3/VPS74 family protein n=1 Tax=Streptomyces sp. NPDC050400 TaxID=3365610 RepID=UPI0037A9F8ED